MHELLSGGVSVMMFQIILGITGPIVLLCGVVLFLGAVKDVDWIARFPGFRAVSRRLTRICIGIIGVLLTFSGGYLGAYEFIQAAFFR